MVKRIGILGGSFNPIHYGHLQLARAVVDCGYADEVWLMVSPQNPLKAKADLLDENLRLKIAEKALENVPNVHACDFEFSLPRPSYTWFTLDSLRQAYPSNSFALIIGADNLANFKKWAKHDYILSNYDIIVYPREGFEMKIPPICKNVVRLDLPKIPWSSTDIRKRLSVGQDVSEMIPPQALKFIAENHLYCMKASICP